MNAVQMRCKTKTPNKHLRADERLLRVELRPAAHATLGEPPHHHLSEEVAVVLRLHPDARTGPGPERILQAAQAEEARFGATGDAEQLQSQPPAVVTAFHLLAVPSGLIGCGSGVKLRMRASAADGRCVCGDVGAKRQGFWVGRGRRGALTAARADHDDWW